MCYDLAEDFLMTYKMQHQKCGIALSLATLFCCCHKRKIWANVLTTQLKLGVMIFEGGGGNCYKCFMGMKLVVL